MTAEYFYLLLRVMSVCALFVFIALYFIKAGYGIFRTKSWGLAIDNRWAWMWMEMPVFVVMLILWWQSDVGWTWPAFYSFFFLNFIIFIVLLFFRF